LLQALAHHYQGSPTSALESLEHALTLAMPEGFVRIFVDTGKPLAELFTNIAAKSGDVRLQEFIIKLRSAFENQKVDHPISNSSVGINKPLSNSRSLVEPLSERELDVLRLLTTDLNGPEIARELIVSLSTLRTHTQNIYAKLGVNDRRAAVRRAEELNLL